METSFFFNRITLLFILVLLPFYAIGQSKEDMKDYFVEIALGDEFGNKKQYLKKWVKPINYYVMGNLDIELIDELKAISNEIQFLTKCTICRVYSKQKANCIVFLGAADDYVKVDPSSSRYVFSNRGLFTFRTNTRNEIVSASMYVDTKRVGNEYAQKHLLREEFTQLMGLKNDSDKYPKSIFYQKWSYTTKYTSLDKILLRTLYHPSLKSGMSPNSVKIVLDKLIR